MKPISHGMIEVVGIAKEFPCGSRTFKQLQVQELLKVPDSKPDIEQIVRVITSGEIISTRLVEVPESTSYEGQVLTGHKLVVEGRLVQKVEYIADNDIQSIHAAEFTKLFSSYIMLEEDMDCNEPVNVDAYIEDVFVMQMDRRTIFKNVAVLLNAVRAHKRLTLDDGCLHRLGYPDNCLHEKNKLFTQLVVEETVCLPDSKPDMEQIVNMLVEPEIISLRFINTIKGLSVEGQRLTGKKAIVEIKLKQKILYVADAVNQSVHGMENEFFVSAYIVVPPSLEGTRPELLLKHRMLKADIKIEDTFMKQLGKRCIFKSISMLVKLQMIPTYEICGAYHENCTNSRLHIMYGDGSNDTPITYKDSHKCIKPQWSPTGNEIAFLKGDSRGYMLHKLDIKNLKNHQLTFSNQFDTVSSFAWMDQGRRIVFAGMAEGCKDIYTVDLADLSCERLTDSKGTERNFKPQVSPDGRQIAFIKSVSNLKNIWVMDYMGRNCRKITEGGGARDYQWCMDGNSIVYVLSKDCTNDRLCCVDICSKGRCILVDEPYINKINNLRTSPDGKHVAFLGSGNCGESIYIYEFDRCRLSRIAESDLNSHISDLIWKIDSSCIYYASDQLGCCNIYSIDTDRHERRQLTNTQATSMELAYRPTIISY